MPTTTIKIRGNVKIKGCCNCPFLRSWPIDDYGELTMETKEWCEVTKTSMNSIEMSPDEKLDDCPLISVETTKDSES